MESQGQERERSEPRAAGRKPALSARCVMRVLADAEIGTVIAYEPEVKSADGARSLVFENDAFYLRVYRYPDDWRRLPDAELLRLMHEAPV